MTTESNITEFLKNDVIFKRKGGGYTVKIIAVTKKWVIVERIDKPDEEMTWKISRFSEEFELSK